MRYRLEYALAWLVIRTLGALPRPLARAVGIALGQAVYLLQLGFTIWMMVDAYRHGVEQFWYWIILFFQPIFLRRQRQDSGIKKGQEFLRLGLQRPLAFRPRLPRTFRDVAARFPAEPVAALRFTGCSRLAAEHTRYLPRSRSVA